MTATKIEKVGGSRGDGHQNWVKGRACHDQGEIVRGEWFSTCSTEAWGGDCFSPRTRTLWPSSESLRKRFRTRRMRLCASCLMPNHWHLVVWPQRDGDLSAFMQKLTNMRLPPFLTLFIHVTFSTSPPPQRPARPAAAATWATSALSRQGDASNLVPGAHRLWPQSGRLHFLSILPVACASAPSWI